MKKINKVVIPIAGKGTRFLPITKGICKTMLPIVNKPTIQYLLEEAVYAGINEAYIIISPELELVQNYFNLNSTYYNGLTKEYRELEELEDLLSKININYIVQTEPNGLGAAISLMEQYIINEDFAVMLGDDLVAKSKEFDHYGIGSLINDYQIRSGYYLGVQPVPYKDTSKYGIVKIPKRQKLPTPIQSIIEKPINNPPSNFACLGRYILRNSIFKYLNQTESGLNGEVQLTDAIAKVIENEVVYASFFEGTRFDIGSRSGFIKANVAYALENEEFQEEMDDFIKEMVLCQQQLEKN